MRILINQDSVEVNHASGLLSVLKLAETELEGCAIAINNQVIPSIRWQTEILKENDHILVFRAIAGG
ncbi:sulfur carrier protein ThiS [Teredinibacter franksiae]|uniref:sulfur carrier protein ThiS n=1 Tax=Teredinibacter franksiae TaxID=2761453 RepID=UPI001FE6055B|nr:sulfur carrier protein ThiS [Teredinibacter franksiae]